MTLRNTYLIGLAILAFSGVAAEAAPAEEFIPLGTDARAQTSPRNSFGGNAPRVELFGQVRLGNREATLGRNVRSCGKRGERVAAIRLRALITPANLARAEIFFGNGARQVVTFRRGLGVNSDTGWIPLSRVGGPNPCVRAVAFRGQNGNLTPDSSVVQIFGHIAEARTPPARDARRNDPKAARRPAPLTLSQANP